MQAQVVIVGAVRGLDELVYEIPASLTGAVVPGCRVMVPLRSRRVTAVVVEVGEELAPAEERASLKPVIELLDADPLFDSAHLKLLEFLANYYMASLGEVYRSVIPSVARVESRLHYRLASTPDPLRAAALTSCERKIIEALEKSPAPAARLEKLGQPGEIRQALGRLLEEKIIDRHDGTRGRHRQAREGIVRVNPAFDFATLRGSKQREVVELIRSATPDGIPLGEISARFDDVGAILKKLEERGAIEVVPLAVESNGIRCESGPALTGEQQSAIDAVSPAVLSARFQSFLLWGVTGSGKTEIYLHLAARALGLGRQVLVMVPEIALADETVRSFRARFGSLVAIAHSAQNVSERWSSWTSAIAGDARIMIGPRSAIFAPIRDAGLIIVDEEHDPAYKSEEGIRYNARDLAVALGSFLSCPVVLGSATPSIESFANARRGRYRLLRLARRVNDRAMAEVELIDLRRSLRPVQVPNDCAGSVNGNAPQSPATAIEPVSAPDTIPIAPELSDALRINLASGGQSIVFLNRRGFHNFLQCGLCGNVIACPNCSVSMTFHLYDRSLRCHYCGNGADAPDVCPACRGYGLSGVGFGTERLTSALEALIPGARIERMDSDTSGRRGARARILAALRAREIDVLVGTQMVTKGFDFPGVTLVAVVLADLGLNMPDFRSAERTFQLLTQVAGRAGRGENPGRVMIQTRAPHNYSIRAARDQDYARFARRELELRRELGYPPFARLAMVRIEGEDAAAVGRIAQACADSISRAASSPESIRVMGPAPAPIERIKHRYRWQVMLKARELQPMREALAAMRSELGDRARERDVHLIIDIDPVRML